MTTFLLAFALLWVGSSLVCAAALVVLAYGDEVRVRIESRRMWRQVRELQR